MTTPTLSTPPATRPDQVSGDPAAFNAAKAAWYAWHQTHMPELVAYADWLRAQGDAVTGQRLAAEGASGAASASAAAAQQAQAAAQAAVAYKGTWASLTGALAVPATVQHGGALWMLASNLTNVATAEPGVAAEWLYLWRTAPLPVATPTLLATPAASRSLPAGLALTRASGAWQFDAAGALASVGINAARYDFDPATGDSLGLLVERASTNGLHRSADLTNTGSWARSNLASATAVNLFGQPWVKLVENTVNNRHYLRQTFSPAAEVQTLTIDAMAGERTTLNLFVNVAGLVNGEVLVNLVTGAVTNAAGGANLPAGITCTTRQLAGGGWRVRYTRDMTGVTSVTLGLRGAASTYYEGDGVSGLYLRRPQCEPGDAATSYIETPSTVAVTRARDALSAAAPAGMAVHAGALYWEGRPHASTMTLLQADDGTDNHSLRLELLAGALRVVSCVAGTPTVWAIGTNLTAGALARVAVDWQSDGTQLTVRASVNGGAAVASTLPLPAALSQLRVGGTVADTSGAQHLRELRHYPRALSAADLQALTLPAQRA